MKPCLDHSGPPISSLTNHIEVEPSRGKGSLFNGLHNCPFVYMNGDLNDDKGKYVEYKKFVRPSAVHDITYIFLNYHDELKYLIELDEAEIDENMNFIIFISKEHFNEKFSKIKAIKRKCRSFWFPLERTKLRCIPVCIIIELVRLVNEYNGINLKVISSRNIIFTAANYINQIFNAAIEIKVPTPTPEPVISDQDIKNIQRILKENFSSCFFFDLDNIPKINQNDINRNTQNIFVRNLKTRDPNICKMDNIIKVPTEKDSADAVIIIMMTFIATFRKKCKCIYVKSNDGIYKKAKIYISIDQNSNQNINIIDSSSNQFKEDQASFGLKKLNFF